MPVLIWQMSVPNSCLMIVVHINIDHESEYRKEGSPDESDAKDKMSSTCDVFARP